MLCGMRAPRESFKLTGLTLQSPRLVTAPADPDMNHFILVKTSPHLSTAIWWGTCVLSTLDREDPGRFPGYQILPVMFSVWKHCVPLQKTLSPSVDAATVIRVWSCRA